MSRPGSSSSILSDSSYTSVLSDDSYLAQLEPGLDDQFKEMLNNLRMIENNRKILTERKIQSHEAKKRDPTDVSRRIDWTPQMDADYLSYKAKVEVVAVTHAAQKVSGRLARKSKHADLATQEAIRSAALADDEKWLDAAIEAATARLGFMTKYPNALHTTATKTHIKAAEDNLNSAKHAKREIETQKKKIENARVIAIIKGAISNENVK
ncbi:hypothetical protein AB5N19_00206 [Seiridium cardinale]